MANWWDNVVTPYRTDTSITLPSGKHDVEKGDIIGVPAGTAIGLPVPATVAYANKYQEVLQIPGLPGFINLMHLNTDVATGQTVPPGSSLGRVAGSGPEYDPSAGYSGYSTGGIVEFGYYNTLRGAILRDNPNPYDFTGINNPSSVRGALDMASNSGGGNPTKTNPDYYIYNPSNIGATSPDQNTYGLAPQYPGSLSTQPVPTNSNWAPPAQPSGSSLGSLGAPLGNTGEQLGGAASDAANAVGSGVSGAVGGALGGIAASLGLNPTVVILAFIIIVVLLIRK